MCKKLVCLVSVVLVLSLAGNASAAIVFDAVSTGVDGGGDDTLSWSHTIGSGSNRILIVAPANEDGDEEDMAITSIKYNNVSMTAVSGGSSYEDPVKAYLYYMLEEDLPSAGTYTIQIDYADTVSDLIGGAISLSGVAQEAPEAVATNSDEDENVISTNITTQTDDAWVVDVVCHSRGENFITTTGGMTERYDEDSGAHTAAGATKAVASAGSTTMSWEFDGSTDPLVHVLAAFAPADGAPSPPGKATNPSPSHQATGVSITANLSWSAGSGATSHDVYFGTDSTPDAGEFKVNQAGTTYEPGTMSYNTTHYWRIDEKNSAGTTTGDVWSFTTEQQPQNPPGKATNPSPSHQATGVSLTADLSWSAGSGATSHDVYFGTDSTPDAGEFKGNQPGTTYEPGTLTESITYYWRIDEVNAYGTTTGDVWSFTTTSGGGTGSGATPVAEFMVIPTSGWDIYYRPEFVSKATGDITSYEWDFGDEQTSSERAPNHQYSSPGTYTVSLTVSGPGGSDIETKTSHITVNDFDDYPYDDYVLTSATMAQWDDAVDDIETAGGGRILFDFTNQTIYINHHRDFYGDNLIIDGQDKNVSLYYNGPDDCSQTEDQDALIRVHGDDNIFRNVDYDRFPEGISMRDGYRNVIENVTVDVICEDAMTMNGSGYECYDCIFRNCTLGESEDKAVMVNNGGRGVFRNISTTDSRQPIRCTGSSGEYVIRHCDFGGTLNTSTGPRCDGGSPGHLVYFEENTVNNSQRGIRVYGYVDAIIRHNSFSNGNNFGVYIYDNAKARLEHNTITGYSLDGVSVDGSALADLGGGSVSIDGSSAASPGGNASTGNSAYDVQNNTGTGIKAEYNYWDHSTVSDVEQYDVDGTVDVDPLGS